MSIILCLTQINLMFIFLLERQCKKCLRPKPIFKIGGSSIEFVHQWHYLGHILIDTFDDREDILYQRNARCRKINKLLCYFSKLKAVTIVSLLNTFCNSLHGSELWHLVHSSVHDVCISLQKGVHRVWVLSLDAHCDLLTIMCDCIPLIHTLFSRSANFINCCLKRDNLTVCAVTRHGVYYSHMRFSMGISAFNCCMCYGICTGNISIINSKFVNFYVKSLVMYELLSKEIWMLELIFIRGHTFSVCNWSYDEISAFIDYHCREWYICLYCSCTLQFSLNCLI